MLDKIYKFTERETGNCVGYSRHEIPDFVNALAIARFPKCVKVTREDILELRDTYFIVEEITDQEEIRKNTI